MAKTKTELGTSLSGAEQMERYRGCINGVCVVGEGDDARIEVHLDGSNPLCSEFTKLLAPAAVMGVPTQYSVDAPEAPKKAPPANRKG